jgi:hypothetical protein
MNRTARRLLFAAVTFASLPLVASADDRDVLRAASARPYVQIILDTSGSMNWAPRCTAQQVSDGVCTFLCPNGDCSTPRNGDDPASKFRQAKEALYEVLESVADIDFGFASYNQDNVSIEQKHWLYQVNATQPNGFFSLAGGVTFPVAGSQEVFGGDWWGGNTCQYASDNDGDANDGYDDDVTDAHIGCFPRRPNGTAATDDDCDDANGNGNNTSVCAPADTNDAWEYTRFRRLPRLDLNGSTETYLYLRVPNGSTRYRVRYSGAITYGSSSIAVTVRVAACTNNKCSTVGTETTKTINYTLIDQFIHYDNRIARTATPGQFAEGWFGEQDSSVSNTCSGWDTNTDTGNDDNSSGYNLKQPNGTPFYDPPNTANDWRFVPGDSIPMTWTQDNVQQILRRLAPDDPDLVGNEAFATARYLNDNRLAGQTYLRYKDTNKRVLLPNGSTPIGHSLKTFRTWYRGCSDDGNCNGGTGWDDIAAVNDSQWGCRRKFLIFLTDGDDTCSGGDTADMTEAIIEHDNVGVFVVAFGVQGVSGNQLDQMANRGAEVIYPQNKQELVDALTNILGAVREQSAAFASAAVPQVQANVTDKIFLSSFTPLNDSSYWAGRLDAFLKPLPLDDGRPNREILCDSSRQSQCFLWDAGDVQAGHRGGDGTYDPQRLLLQAPHPDDLQPVAPWNASSLQIGNGADERRVYYTQMSEPGNRRLFTFPTTNAEKYDLWSGLGLTYVVGNAPSEAAALAEANAAIVNTLLEKEAIRSFQDPADPDETIDEPITFLLGDIFHADPVVMGRPSNFNYYSTDPYLNKPLCGAAADPSRTPPPSYRAFADRNFCRRSVLLAAANDGQLHAFDAGIFRNAGGGEYECLLPAKDLDGDGNAEANEFSDSLIDYDLGDDVNGNKECSSDSDCSSGPCNGGFCRDVKVGVVDGAYDNGSGREIFSFIPRAMLPTVFKAANGADRNSEFWGIDAGIRVDDVFIDPLASDTGSVTCLSRQWRTVGIGGYREGGAGYYALDLTQPDALDSENVPTPDNGYVPSCAGGSSACGNRPYPSVLWEFNDHALVAIPGLGNVDVALDEDLNDVPDLGNSWGKVSTGRIRVCTGACGANDAEDRFVAVFGGGLGNSPDTATGNFIYVVDIETGRTIYKERILGSAAADVAAIDSNGDTYLDRLYVGTTGGFVYKVQFETNPSVPMLLSTQTLQTRVAGVNRSFQTVRLIGPTGDNNKYDPFQVFSTGGRAIYLEVGAIFVREKNRIAMAFGTGNRWNLWDESGETGRFYMILDDNFQDTDRDGVLDVICAGCTEPLTEAKYAAIDPDSAFNPASPTYYLYDGGGGGTLPGWYFTMAEDEKLITESF